MRFSSSWTLRSALFILGLWALPLPGLAWVADCRPALFDAPHISVVSGSLLAGASGSRLEPGGDEISPLAQGVQYYWVRNYDEWPSATMPPEHYSAGPVIPFFRAAAQAIGGSLEVVKGSKLPEFKEDRRLGGNTVAAAMAHMETLFPQAFHADWDPVRRVLRLSGAMRMEVRVPLWREGAGTHDLRDAGALLSLLVRSYGGHEVSGSGDGVVRFSVDAGFFPGLRRAVQVVEHAKSAVILDVLVFERDFLASIPEGRESGGYALSGESGRGEDGYAGLTYRIHGPPGVRFASQGADLLLSGALSGRRIVIPEPPRQSLPEIDPRSAVRVDPRGCARFYAESMARRALAAYLPPFWVAFAGYTDSGYARIGFGLGDSPGVSFNVQPESVALLSFRGRALSGRRSEGYPGLRVPAFTVMIRFRERRASFRRERKGL